MKKWIALLVVLVLLTLVVGAVGCQEIDEHTIVIGATAVPHAEILEQVKGELAKLGYTLEIRVYDDYVLPNVSLEDGSLSANYFQHEPYLNSFNSKNGTQLVSVAKIHYEPMSLFGTAEGKSGHTIIVPSDDSNLTRALLLLASEGYITLKGNPTANDSLTEYDIADDNGNEITLMAADMLAATYKQGGVLAVINGNYALEAGLNLDESIARESADSDSAQTYANLIAVKKGHENDPKIQALVSVLQSKAVYDYIVETYGGAVLPVFSLDK